MFIFESSTPQELLKELAEFFRNEGHKRSMCPARSKLARRLNEAAVSTFNLAASMLDRAAIEGREASHAPDCAQRRGGECGCGAFEHNERVRLPFSVGRNDFTGEVRRFATLAEAEAHIGVIEKTDPAGVHAGDYYVDGPEELINPPENTFTGVENALAVMVLSRNIREYLELYDPKAMAQAERALVGHDMSYAVKLREARSIAASAPIK